VVAGICAAAARGAATPTAASASGSAMRHSGDGSAAGEVCSPAKKRVKFRDSLPGSSLQEFRLFLKHESPRKVSREAAVGPHGFECDHSVVPAGFSRVVEPALVWQVAVQTLVHPRMSASTWQGHHAPWHDNLMMLSLPPMHACRRWQMRACASASRGGLWICGPGGSTGRTTACDHGCRAWYANDASCSEFMSSHGRDCKCSVVTWLDLV
jgi:hypothetical protein